MKLVPNMFLLNVSDVGRAKAFYESIFDIEVTYEAPRFAAYEIAPGCLLALQGDWIAPPAGHRPNAELVLNTAASREAFDEMFASWLKKGATEVEPPHEEVFGYTFVVADPDSNLIRVAPVD